MVNAGKLNKRIVLVTSKIVEGEIVQQEVTVWAGISSITRTEFYVSQQSGMNPQIVFAVRSSAYKLSKVIDDDNSIRYATSVKYNGVIYNIIRTYEHDNLIEIVCG
jgi:head-tail adaptor